MLIDKLNEQEREQVLNAEYQLTHRQALILMALAIGSYNATGIGSTLGNDAGESTLLELGMIERVNGELSPTTLGRATAQSMFGTVLDVISTNLTALLDA